jgi:hypothetical protein
MSSGSSSVVEVSYSLSFMLQTSSDELPITIRCCKSKVQESAERALGW